jgi:hypothetical protein
MSTLGLNLNTAKAKFAQVTVMASQYKSQIMLVVYLLVSIIVFYIVYIVLFPPPDVYEHVVIRETMPATGLQEQHKLKNNITIETGGEYTLQTWIYISNWDYKAGQVKHVFTLASDGKSGNGRPEHITMLGALYPSENKMMIRVFQDTTTASNPAPAQGPDFTVRTNLENLFSGSVGMGAFDNSIGFPICDIQDIDLQKWICLAIVVNGRVIDVYVDGKLARSCVTAGIPTVEKGSNYLTVGQFTGWGGNVSTTRVFGYALTPGRIYEIYQNGPAETSAMDSKYGFLGWLATRLGYNLYWSSPTIERRS